MGIHETSVERLSVAIAYIRIYIRAADVSFIETDTQHSGYSLVFFRIYHVLCTRR